MRRRLVAGAGLTALVVACAAGTFALGYVQKLPCAGAVSGPGYASRHLCYTDTAALYRTEDLGGERLPILDPCHPPPGARCDEYPVLQMYLMRGTSLLAHASLSFFRANALLLLVACMITAAVLARVTGRRALLFALAPTLVASGLINLDLVPVALVALAALAFLRDRDRLCGVLLGLGAAVKVYPALLLVPFAAERLRQGRRGDARRLAAWGAGSWMVVNLPFIALALDRWSFSFRFAARRPLGWDTVWAAGCQGVTGTRLCRFRHIELVNVLSVVAFLVVATLVWRARARRRPDTPRWMMAFPLIAALLLTAKVYTPQYSLWLLPWFALALPDVRLFLAFEATDLAVFVTGTAWRANVRAQRFGFDPGWVHHIGLGVFQAAISARAVVLVACLLAFALARDRPGENGWANVVPAGRSGASPQPGC